MANTLSAHNTHVVFYIAFHSACTLINMANALSAYNTHVVFYRAFHFIRFIYINKHG